MPQQTSFQPSKSCKITIYESQEAIKDHNIMLDRTEESTLRGLTGQRWDNLSISKNKNCNILKHIKYAELNALIKTPLKKNIIGTV